MPSASARDGTTGITLSTDVSRSMRATWSRAMTASSAEWWPSPSFACSPWWARSRRRMPDESMNAHSLRSRITGCRPSRIARMTGSSRSPTVAMSMSPSTSTTYGIPTPSNSGTRTSTVRPPQRSLVRFASVDSGARLAGRFDHRAFFRESHSRSPGGPSAGCRASLLSPGGIQPKYLDREARLVELSVACKAHDPPAGGALDGRFERRSDRLLEVLPHLLHGVRAPVLDQVLLVGQQLEVVQEHDHGVVHHVGLRAGRAASVRIEMDGEDVPADLVFDGALGGAGCLLCGRVRVRWPGTARLVLQETAPPTRGIAMDLEGPVTRLRWGAGCRPISTRSAPSSPRAVGGHQGEYASEGGMAVVP